MSTPREPSSGRLGTHPHETNPIIDDSSVEITDSSSILISPFLKKKKQKMMFQNMMDLVDRMIFQETLIIAITINRNQDSTYHLYQRVDNHKQASVYFVDRE
jgi:hypothetical protein